MKRNIWVLVLGVLVSQPLWAARSGTVNAPDVNLYAKADSTSTVLEVLHQGDHFAASNASESGFYKVRTLTRKIGFLEQGKLLLGPMSILPGEKPVQGRVTKPVAPAAPTPAPKLEVKPVKPVVPEPGFPVTKAVPKAKRFALSVSAGPQLIGMTGVVSTLNIQATFYFAATAGYNFVRMASGTTFGAAFRVEAIRQPLLLTDLTTSATYALQLGVTPISLGVRVGRSVGRFAFHGAVYGTAALNSYATVTDTADGTSGSLLGNIYGGLAVVDVSLRFSSFFNIALEGGYRLLSSSGISSTGNASVLTSPGVLNWSGLFGGIAFGLEF